MPESEELSDSSDGCGNSVKKKPRKLLSDRKNFHSVKQNNMNESPRNKKVAVNVNQDIISAKEQHRTFLNANLFPSRKSAVLKNIQEQQSPQKRTPGPQTKSMEEFLQ